MRSRVAILLLSGSLVLAACAGDESTVASTTELGASSTVPDWVEEEVLFPFGDAELFGVLTIPATSEPAPAIVLVSGSESSTTGMRAGVASQLHTDHSRALAEEGFVVLRYDPPGVGGSTGEVMVPSIEERSRETLASVHFLQTRPEIMPGEIGLLGWSQGPWVMGLAAATHPDDVAFLVSVVGSGQSVADQQLYGIEAQSRAAGLDETDVLKASVFGRLLIDWQLDDPQYQNSVESDVADLGDGPWLDFMTQVYNTDNSDPVADLDGGIEILKSIQDEAWAAALYLEELYLPRLESLPPDLTAEQLGTLQAVTAASLLFDPQDFLTAVRCPLLAIFGADDVTVDSATSVELFKEYLDEAGNDDVTLVVLDGVGHNISIDTRGYWQEIRDWLQVRYP